MDFPNLSFTSELADSTSPQFRLQAQALNDYVSGISPSARPSIFKADVSILTLELLVSSVLPLHGIRPHGTCLTFVFIVLFVFFVPTLAVSSASVSSSDSAGVKCKAETGHGTVCVCVRPSSPDPVGEAPFRTEDKPGVCESGEPRSARARGRADLQ